MKQITVNYIISNEEYKRLEKLTETCAKNGMQTTPDELFRSIMTMGCIWDIKDKLTFAEWQMGTMNEEEYKEKKDSWKYEKCGQ